MPDYPPDIMEKARECAKDACPSDIREFGERHKIPRFAEATYGNGFIDGYRQGALAERQRCAEVAQGIGNKLIGRAIADAIMNPEPTDG